MSARHASCLITGYRYISIFSLGWGFFWLLSGYHIPHLFVSLCFVTWDTEVRALSSLTGDQLCCMIDLRGKEYIIFLIFFYALTKNAPLIVPWILPPFSEMLPHHFLCGISYIDVSSDQLQPPFPKLFWLFSQVGRKSLSFCIYSEAVCSKVRLRESMLISPINITDSAETIRCHVNFPYISPQEKQLYF